MSLSLSEENELVQILEIERANDAGDSLDAYVRYIDIPGVPIDEDDEDCEEFYPDTVTPAAHHMLVNETLERVADGELKRVMLFLPPGSAKSTYGSVVFPTYYMGKNPGHGVICTSYGDDLAKKFGRKCRSIVRSDKYQKVFQGTTLTGDNFAVDDWSLTNKSYYMACGIMAAVTGNRCHGLLIDDPVKNRQDADSSVVQERTWEGYKTDLKTRVVPSGWVIIIQTRWNEDDLSGRILPENYDGESGWVESRDGEPWFVVNIPAECERDDDPLGRKPGEFLWTEWFPVEWWEQTKREQKGRNWSALYQQRPAPEEGSFFKAEWLKFYDKAPARDTLRVYGASDYAVTDDAGDYTAHVVVGIDPSWNMYVLDLWRKQADSAEWVESFCDLVLEWKPLEWAEESGQIKAGVGPFLTRTQIERKAYVARKTFPTKYDKAIRAQSIRGRMAMHGLYVPADAPWYSEFRRELLAFPAGRHDDQVDALGLIGQLLDHVLAGQKPKDVPPPKHEYESAGDHRMFGNLSVSELIARQTKRRREREGY